MPIFQGVVIGWETILGALFGLLFGWFNGR